MKIIFGKPFECVFERRFETHFEMKFRRAQQAAPLRRKSRSLTPVAKSANGFGMIDRGWELIAVKGAQPRVAVLLKATAPIRYSPVTTLGGIIRL
jgi:hypothetical protein